MEWQDILLITIFIMNGTVAYQALRIYRTQNIRINTLQKHTEELKNANFGTIEEIVKPIKEYINLLEDIKGKENTLLKNSNALAKLNNIEDIAKKNMDSIEILLKTRLTNTEVFSQLTDYSDENV